MPGHIQMIIFRLLGKQSEHANKLTNEFNQKNNRNGSSLERVDGSIEYPVCNFSNQDFCHMSITCRVHKYLLHQSVGR